MMDGFQVLLSNSTCAATPREPIAAPLPASCSSASLPLPLPLQLRVTVHILLLTVHLLTKEQVVVVGRLGSRCRWGSWARGRGRALWSALRLLHARQGLTLVHFLSSI